MNLILGLLLLFSADISQLKKADQYYRDGKYEDALIIYQAQLNEEPGNYSIAFNIGNTLYKLGRYDEAKKAFQRAESLTQSAEKSANSYYNQSLTGIKSEKTEEAIKDLKNAIKLNPEDKDARANFEIMSRLLDKKKQEQKQDKKDNKDQKDKDKKDDKNQDKDNKNQDQNKKDQEKKDKQDQQNKQDQKQQEDKKKQQQQAKISPEQAARLLDAMKKNEKEQLLKRADFQKRNDRRKTDKDW